MIGMKSIELIAEERKRQKQDLGFDDFHDSGEDHQNGELEIVAALYAVAAADTVEEVHVVRMYHQTKAPVELVVEDAWPETWNDCWDKRGSGTKLRKLVKAGALIAAAIDKELRKNGN